MITLRINKETNTYICTLEMIKPLKKVNGTLVEVGQAVSGKAQPELFLISSFITKKLNIFFIS